MPELPEVETVRRGLASGLAGRLVEHVQVLRKESVAYPGWRQFARQLAGHRFEYIDRRGKYLILSLDGGARLAAHLRMSGRLLIVGRETADGPHLRVRMSLSDGLELRFEDTRVFGRLWYVADGVPLEAVVTGLASLGPDALDGPSAKHLKTRFSARSQPVKAALLDQSVLAGLGNIYADESLARAGINPLAPAGSLSSAQLRALAQAIKEVLATAIALGGSTLRDYTDSRGVNGRYQHESIVYGRAGQPCACCGEKICRVRIGGRSSHYCPVCQRL